MPESQPHAAYNATPEPTRSGEPVVVCQRLTKVFKDFWLRDRARAVDSLTFEIRRGEIFGLLGPNGSGKSTTIKMILGLLRPTSGRIAVFGKAPTEVSIKRRIGYLPEESYLYGFLNARETLDYYGKLFELDHTTRRRRIDELLDMIGLTGAQFRAVREYSKGMQRRIGIAQALINDPEFLILDEPTTGLDPLGTKQVKDLIVDLGRRGKTILLCSHLLADVEDCVDRMSILYGGQKRAEGTCDDLLASRTRMSIETEPLDDDTVSEIDRVVRTRSHGERSILRVSRPRQRLEELFLDIVERARQEQLSTSGAQSGGQTAAFLKGDAHEGESLIEKLVRNEPEPSPAPPEAALAPVEPEAEMDKAIDALLDAYEESPSSKAAPTPSPTPHSSKPAPKPNDDIDRSVIDSLLESGDGENSDGRRDG